MTPPSAVLLSSSLTNFLRILCNASPGPWTSTALGAFDPTQNLEIYVNASPAIVQSTSFNADVNGYDIYTSATFDPAGVIQVIHRIPASPFRDINLAPVAAFAVVAEINS